MSDFSSLRDANEDLLEAMDLEIHDDARGALLKTMTALARLVNYLQVREMSK